MVHTDLMDLMDKIGLGLVQLQELVFSLIIHQFLGPNSLAISYGIGFGYIC
jgi:hypothetical protein